MTPKQVNMSPSFMSIQTYFKMIHTSPLIIADGWGWFVDLENQQVKEKKGRYYPKITINHKLDMFNPNYYYSINDLPPIQEMNSLSRMDSLRKIPSLSNLSYSDEQMYKKNDNNNNNNNNNTIIYINMIISISILAFYYVVYIL